VCGIAGLLLEDPSCAAQAAELQAMVAALTHRGPDGEGIELDGPLGLGHRRLSIIDLSEAGRQPLANEDRSLLLVCNGEIYNHRELRRELEGRGHEFRSLSDNEVILHLYEDEGESAVKRLNGMFAFALWDGRRRRLVLARDRVGQKPLHYREDADAFRFASEPFALHAAPGVRREPNRRAIHDFLALGYVPAPRSAFAGARKLLPGHLLIKESGRPARIERYWSHSYLPKFAADSAAQRSALAEDLRTRLGASVRRRMMSDVPLGAFLSGGVDSSAIVAFMAEHARREGASPPRSFSIGFSDQSFDERAHARLVADHVGAKHLDEEVSPDALQVLSSLTRKLGEPFADSSVIPTWYLCRLARRHVTVALSGDGGDELFGGYMRYVANDIAALYQRLPKFIRRRAIKPLVAALPERRGRDDPLQRLKRFIGAFESDPHRRGLSWSRLLPAARIPELYSEEMAADLLDADPLEIPLAHHHAADAEELNDRALHADLSSYLPDDILVKVDIASMSLGLECRAPFLDPDLVEFAARLPLTEKVRLFQTKRLLKRAMTAKLPASILKRPKKGFAVPLGSWLRGPLSGWLKQTLLAPDARSAAYLRPEGVARLLAEFHAGARLEHLLWALTSLELWLQELERPALSRAEELQQNQRGRGLDSRP